VAQETVKVRLSRREVEQVEWMLNSPDGRLARGIRLFRTTGPQRGVQNYLEGTKEQLLKLQNLATTASKMGWSENLAWKLGKAIDRHIQKRSGKYMWRHGAGGYRYYESKAGGVGVVHPAEGGGWVASTWLGDATRKTLKEAKEWVEKHV